MKWKNWPGLLGPRGRRWRKKAVECAKEGGESPKDHVGFYLVGNGRKTWSTGSARLSGEGAGCGFPCWESLKALCRHGSVHDRFHGGVFHVLRMDEWTVGAGDGSGRCPCAAAEHGTGPAFYEYDNKPPVQPGPVAET